MALEGSQRFALGLAFADAAVETGTGFGLVFGADDRDGVDRVIDSAIAAAVEPVSDGLARGVFVGGRESELLGLWWEDLDLRNLDAATIRLGFQADRDGPGVRPGS